MELDNVFTHATALEEALTSFGRRAARRLATPGRDQGLGFPTHSQLQELEERLSRILLQSRDLHNMFSSKDQVLPDDVLHLILEQACVVRAKPPPSSWEHSSIFYGSSMFSGSTARILSGVCRRWRSLLLSNPIVWSDVHVTIRRPENLSWLDACLARSASSPTGCMIQIDRPAGTLQGADLTGAISRHPSNIRCLQINPRTKEDYDFLTLNMGNLERLHIKAGTFGRISIPAVSHLSKLRMVILQRLPTVPHDAFINITDLTLDNIISPIINLVDILQANQTLEKIRITRTVVAADPHERLASLPNLKLLCISHSSPVTILRILSPLPTPSRVTICDDTTNLLISSIRTLFSPFLMFGPDDFVRAVSTSILSGGASVTFHTYNDATVDITVQPAPLAAGGGLPAEFSSLLQDVARWGPFPDLCSMHLHIEPTATGPIHNVIDSLLSGVPRMIHLSFSGPTLFRHICQALNPAHASGIICPELEFLGGTLRPDDDVVEDLHSLSEALKRRPTTIQKIALYIPVSEEEITGIRVEAGPPIEEMRTHGVHELLLTPIPEWSYMYDAVPF
ncbi:hypothetical protein BDM02DRAFT_3190225 [Thelephora ganbajun]|uniref:Uncharacterized protein n=1 Tax=Thelephora ganbajun TaxID=370292 RepID=A0ACB6Z5D4_THEGA|nr:hypothetical protein BDM02DRAFT_3190225 [Thelephora ganbajun]